MVLSAWFLHFSSRAYLLSTSIAGVERCDGLKGLEGSVEFADRMEH